MLCCFVAIGLASIPSGPECLTCKRNYTKEFIYKHVSKTTSKVSKVEGIFCFICKDYKNITINGVSKTNLDELEETE